MEKLSVIGRVKTREKSPYLELSDVLASPSFQSLMYDVRLCRWLERVVGTPVKRWLLAGIRCLSSLLTADEAAVGSEC